MNSPAKRRKTDKDVTPRRHGKNIDSFFGLFPAPPAAKQEKATDGIAEPKAKEISTLTSANEDLTDEQLARKLQEEWNNESAKSHREESAVDPRAAEWPQEKDDELYALPEDPRGPSPDELGSQNGQEEVPRSSQTESTYTTNTLSLQSATATEDLVSPTVPFDQSPLNFEPSKYIPELKDQWDREGGRATYAILTRCFVLINSTQSRIKIVDNLVNLLRVVIEGDPDSLLPLVWLATNSISPPYIDLELGLGGSAISKALKKVCGLDSAGLKKLYDRHGDAGDVAFEAKKRQSLTLRKPKPLSIKGVYESLVKIANSRGHGSQENKQRIVERLVQDARGAEESRYIVRTLVQHLRIGAVKTTMLIALSRAFLLTRTPNKDYFIEDQKRLAGLKKEALAEIWSKSEEVVKACFARRPNYNDLVPTLLEVGVCDELLIRCGLALHVPLRPMLGNITRDLGDMLTKLQGRDFTCEFKYDGQRAQVHCDKLGKVTIFSRHLEVMTEKYPDLVTLVPQIRGEGVSSFVLEGEVVAIDRESGELRPFQTLANRARKDVTIGDVKVTVCLFAFDLMYLNGEELLDRPFRERRELLRSLFTEIPNHFTRVKSLDANSSDVEVVSDFFKDAIQIKCEGIMVKALDNGINPNLTDQLAEEPDDEQAPSETPSRSQKKPGLKTKSASGHEKSSGGRRKALLATYEPDKRVDSWLKVKKDYDSSSAETLDLIPIGGWHGQGRKNAWWSPVLLAVRNPESGCLEAVTKCISGFTDKFYAANKQKYAEGSDNVVSRPAFCEYAGEPDVWFHPQEVWEMAFADITLSPTYTAAIGLVSEARGLSTRFPRFLKVREDKTIEEATTSDYLATLYRRQETKLPTTSGNGKAMDEDDYQKSDDD